MRDPSSASADRARVDQSAPIHKVMLNVAGPALYAAVRGLTTASGRYDAAAQKVAAGDASELVEATVLAPAAYTANAVVARTAAETSRSLLDVRA